MIILFLVPFVLSFIVLIAIIHYSHKHDIFMDAAHEKKPQNYHDTCTPRAGGMGIMAGLLLLVLSPFGFKILIPVILASLSGIFEDFHNSLGPKVRLVMQFIAALVAIYLTQAVVTYLGLDMHLPYWFGVVFSAVAIVGMMNAINIIDGFNGLASGVVLLILLSFGITAYTHNNTDILDIVLMTGGATLSFFFFVFPKGKIFLGDGGAYLLGFMVAIIGIFLASKYDTVSPWYVMALFIYPVWEVLFSIIRKLSIGYSPLKPDANHFHMLVHRHLSKNNALTAVLILIFILPFMITSTCYPHNSTLNIIVSISFIVVYLLLYWYLYQKEIKEKVT